MPRNILAKVVILSTLLLSFSAHAQLQFSNGWIKHLPSAMPMRAGYLSIFNPDDTALSIISISSKAFAMVEMHQSMMKSGIMSMQKIDTLVLQPQQRINLEPGGYHLMLMNPLKSINIGDIIQITLKLSDGSKHRLAMSVKK